MILSGVDPTGAAGFLLDSAIATAEGFVPAGVPTCLVAENHLRVSTISHTDADVFLESVKALIEEGRVCATKIGLISDRLAGALSEFIRENREMFGKIIFDPVLSATSGYRFHPDIKSGIKELISISDLIMPNNDEFRMLTGFEFFNTAAEPAQYLDVIRAKRIAVTGIKENDVIKTYLVERERIHEFENTYFEKKVRGTGCAFSTMVACQVARGANFKEAVKIAVSRIEHLVKESLPISENTYQIMAYDLFK